MTRGYLSIRINQANPAHHLYVNTGGRSAGHFWVAYTLHFDDRKRRVRKSLGTRSLAEAIRRRDALFARIREHGEEVPERRRKGQPDSAAEGGMLRIRAAQPPAASPPSSPPPTVPRPTAPGGRPARRCALPSGVRDRRQHVRAADELVAECRRLTALPVDSGNEGPRQWTTAASLYDRAGQAYRRAGLGLAAIAAWSEAALCYAALGHADRRRLFERRVASVPVFHDES
jgi:hypothetical protein